MAGLSNLVVVVVVDACWKEKKIKILLAELIQVKHVHGCCWIQFQHFVWTIKECVLKAPSSLTLLSRFNFALPTAKNSVPISLGATWNRTMLLVLLSRLVLSRLLFLLLLLLLLNHEKASNSPSLTRVVTLPMLLYWTLHPSRARSILSIIFRACIIIIIRLLLRNLYTCTRARHGLLVWN